MTTVVAVPAVETAVDRPLLSIVATSGAAVQVTADVRSAVELSEYVPMAVNCLVKPVAMTEAAGSTSIATSAGATTVAVV
jgi:hypothetical protein